MQKVLTVMRNWNTVTGWPQFAIPWSRDNGQWSVSGANVQKKQKEKAYVPTVSQDTRCYIQ